MKERGNYRSIHTVIVDGPDFQALSPGAKLVWYTLKMTLGPSGISVVPSLVGTLMERTGLEAPQIEKGLAQLEAAKWILRERSIVWMVDGLKHDPHLSLANQNHRSQIAQHLNGLPRLAIVDAFRAHYGFAAPPVEMPFPAPDSVTNEPSKMASSIPSKMPSNKASPIREKGEGKGRREKGEGISAAGASGRGTAGRPTWLTPFADAWRSRYGGEMGAGKAVKALSRLVDEHGTEEVERRWGIYLDATAAEYANAPKFAETWGRWAAVIVRPALSVSSSATSTIDDNAAWDTALDVASRAARHEMTAEDFAALPSAIRAGLKAMGGWTAIRDAKTGDLPFRRREFVAAYRAADPTPIGATA